MYVTSCTCFHPLVLFVLVGGGIALMTWPWASSKMDQSRLEISLRSHAMQTQADADTKVESLKKELDQRALFAQEQMRSLELEMEGLLKELEHSSKCVKFVVILWKSNFGDAAVMLRGSFCLVVVVISFFGGVGFQVQGAA